MDKINPDDPGILTDLLTMFINACSDGFNNIQGYAIWLLASFIVIHIAWFGIKWALGTVDGFKEAIPRIMIISFFVFLINQYVYLIDVIFNSFIKAGLSAGNNTIATKELLDPSSILSKGFKASEPLWQSLFEGGFWGAIMDVPQAMIALLGSSIIVFAFLLIIK